MGLDACGYGDGYIPAEIYITVASPGNSIFTKGGGQNFRRPIG